MLTTDRRSLLLGLGLAGTAAMLTGCMTVTANTRPFFERRGLPIGLQTYTLGDEAGKDIAATFAQVAAIGFGEVELPGLYGRSPAEVRKAADAAGLKISSMHIPIMGMGAPGAGLTLQSPTAQLAETAQALGIASMVVPIMRFPADFRPRPGETFQQAIARSIRNAGADLWRETADQLNHSAAALQPHGITLGYHNHNVEFIPHGQQSGWDILVERTDPKLVFFEIDTGWIATAGRDPAGFLFDLQGRVKWLHVKDVAAGNERNTALSMKPAEVGSGVLGWADILAAAWEAGCRHFYVEQEPPFAMPRIEAAKKGFDYLKPLIA